MNNHSLCKYIDIDNHNLYMEISIIFASTFYNEISVNLYD